jgi:hypothetical protein
MKSKTILVPAGQLDTAKIALGSYQYTEEEIVCRIRKVNKFAFYISSVRELHFHKLQLLF